MREEMELPALGVLAGSPSIEASLNGSGSGDIETGRTSLPIGVINSREGAPSVHEEQRLQSIPESHPFRVEGSLETSPSALTSLHDENDRQNQELSLPAVIRFALKFGQAALLFGSSGVRVEAFLEKLVAKTNCFEGNFFITNNELIASVWPSADATVLPTTVMVKAPEGMNLNRLMLLSELAKDVLRHDVSVEDAVLCRLPEIQRAPDPFGVLLVFAIGFVSSSAGLAVLLGGTWWDTALASIGGAVVFAILTLSDMYLPPRLTVWNNAACAFLPAILATAVRTKLPQVSVTIVTLSSVAIPLPGFTISHGLAEVVGQRVTRGIGHLVKGMVTLLQLVMGSWLGVLLVSSITEVPPAQPESPVSAIWFVLFVPLLSFALVVAFQVSYRDCHWTIVLIWISFATTFAASRLIKPNFGTFIAAVVVFVLSNIWSHYFDRPQSIVQVPAILILVSGSIGFQGLTTLLAGETFLGAQQFLQMIIVALLIVAGEYTGNTLVRPDTTL